MGAGGEREESGRTDGSTHEEAPRKAVGPWQQEACLTPSGARGDGCPKIRPNRGRHTR